MSYQSLGFIVFSAVAVLLYYVVGRKRQLWVLALANLAFFAIAGIKYLPFILVTTVTTYCAGRWMGKIYEELDENLAACTDSAAKKALRKKAKSRAKIVLIASIVITAGILVVCKYTTFVLKNVNLILSALNLPEITLFKLILPLGISFYTFMALSYVLDIYWKRYQAEKSFLLYAVFLSYFPHVVQGPIDRFNEFREQVKDGIGFEYKNITFGAQLALWGFFKKLVIADRIGLFVDAVLGNWRECDGIYLILAIVVYSIQIYADFSGCIDIVSGVSELFGIHLRQNFNHPYFSKTMAEFWRRWHISLQEWFKDYVYFPVSTSSFVKKHKKRLKNKYEGRASTLFATCFPILVVWLVTGIWHGAAWKFVAWGLFHAMLLICSNVFEPFTTRATQLLRIDTDNFGWHLIQMARTYFLCCVGRIFFRANSLRNALSIFKRMITSTSLGALFNHEQVYGLNASNVILAVFAVIVLWFVDMLQERMGVRETLARQNIIFRWAVIFCGLFAVIIFGIYGPGYDASSFIYEQF